MWRRNVTLGRVSRVRGSHRGPSGCNLRTIRMLKVEGTNGEWMISMSTV